MLLTLVVSFAMARKEMTAGVVPVPLVDSIAQPPPPAECEVWDESWDHLQSTVESSPRDEIDQSEDSRYGAFLTNKNCTEDKQRNFLRAYKGYLDTDRKAHDKNLQTDEEPLTVEEFLFYLNEVCCDYSGTGNGVGDSAQVVCMSVVDCMTCAETYDRRKYEEDDGAKFQEMCFQRKAETKLKREEWQATQGQQPQAVPQHHDGPLFLACIFSSRFSYLWFSFNVLILAFNFRVFVPLRFCNKENNQNEHDGSVSRANKHYRPKSNSNKRLSRELEEARKQLSNLSQRCTQLQTKYTQLDQTRCQLEKELKSGQKKMAEKGREELLTGNFIEQVPAEELIELLDKLTRLLVRIPREQSRREEAARREAVAQTEHAQNQVVLEREKTCVVCLEEPSAIVFLPCRHMKTCQTCSEPLKHCPLCRALIKDKFVPF
eukprot:gb/GEZN01007676.1/.p1 GENE.gb/GEZN01007676.1/~~gb/GEZN01007676.1/.p1  ORF type:complete len:432 (+),score=76.13 gb/GEZN01007676.1/:95-1390(+)